MKSIPTKFGLFGLICLAICFSLQTTAFADFFLPYSVINLNDPNANTNTGRSYYGGFTDAIDGSTGHNHMTVDFSDSLTTLILSGRIEGVSAQAPDLSAVRFVSLVNAQFNITQPSQFTLSIDQTVTGNGFSYVQFFRTDGGTPSLNYTYDTLNGGYTSLNQGVSGLFAAGSYELLIQAGNGNFVPGSSLTFFDLQISPVPEPSVTALLFISSVFFIARFFQRKQMASQ